MAEKTPHELVMEAFNSFKETNDANLKQRDVVLDDKLTKINAALDGFEDVNARVTKSEAQAKTLQEQLDAMEASINRSVTAGLGGQTDVQAKAVLAGFEHFLRHEQSERDPNAMKPFMEYHNTLVKSVDTGAGYLLAPPEVNKAILKDIIEWSNFRPLVSVVSIGAESYKQPKKTQNWGAARRVGEVEQRSNTGDPAYGMIEFKAPELFARGEISQQMLEDSAYDLVAELQADWVEQFAIKENLEFLLGTGANGQAEGLMVASGIGETVSGDATKITADGLINLYYSLKNPYAKNGTWLLKRSTIAEIRKLKDANNQYLWAPGITGSVPNTILSASYTEMPDMPDVAAGTYPVAFGDFKKAYLVVDRIGLSMQTDFITLADYGVVVFRARRRVGGGVRQAEAFKKLKISA